MFRLNLGYPEDSIVGHMPIVCGREVVVVFITFTELMLHLFFDSGVVPVSS